jgi:hypothetical protein
MTWREFVELIERQMAEKGISPDTERQEAVLV